ncbi:MAG: hypothetical protein COA78_19800 [Blastopirellula sp.]|nr:MAG: hypothetical protein COA78_19800 [Blastopirellula sp.]
MNQTTRTIVRYFSVVTSCLLSVSFLLATVSDATAQLKSTGSAKVHQSSSRWTGPLGGRINVSADRFYSVAQVPSQRALYRPVTQPVNQIGNRQTGNRQPGYGRIERPVTLPSYRWNHYYGGWGGVSYGNPWYNNPMIINYQPTEVIEVPVETPEQPEPRRPFVRKTPLVLEFNQATGKAERRYSSGSKVIENVEK